VNVNLFYERNDFRATSSLLMQRSVEVD
jgi:hypothetical protein